MIRADRVPSTAELSPYVPLSFRMAVGSNIAFFDLRDETAAVPSPNTPAGVIHFAKSWTRRRSPQPASDCFPPM